MGGECCAKEPEESRRGTGADEQKGSFSEVRRKLSRKTGKKGGEIWPPSQISSGHGGEVLQEFGGVSAILAFFPPFRFRACLKIHFRQLHAPLRGRLSPNSVSVAHYASFIGAKSLVPATEETSPPSSLPPSRAPQALRRPLLTPLPSATSHYNTRSSSTAEAASPAR